MYQVNFTSAEGKTGSHTANTLDEALKFIEHLRNNEGVSETKLYQLTEIPIQVKAVYKVDIAGATGEPAEPPAS